MILIIEDDSGAAWTVCDNVERFNTQYTEDRESLINAIGDTIEQIVSETEEYNKDCIKSEEEEEELLEEEMFSLNETDF